MWLIRRVIDDFRKIGIFKSLFAIYFFINLFSGGSQFFDGEFLLGLKLFFGPILCLSAGAGLKGSFLGGTANDRKVGIILCLICLLISYFIYLKDGFWIDLIFVGIANGYIWCFIGFLIGYFSPKKADAQ